MMFEAGDKVRFKGGTSRNLKNGKIYDVLRVDIDGDVDIINDRGSKMCTWGRNFEKVEDNMFTKEMLVPGKHVVELRHGEIFLITVVGAIGKDTQFDIYGTNEDLTSKYSKECDVMKIYELRIKCSFKLLDEKIKIQLPVWTRQEKTQKQIDMEKLGEQIKEQVKHTQEMQAQYDKLQED